MSTSADELTAALRWIGIAEQSGDDRSYRDAAERSLVAVRAVLDDEPLWSGLKKPVPAGEPAPGGPELHRFLGDQLVEVLGRVAYRPPPGAADLMDTLRRIVTTVAEPSLPTASRADLAGALKHWLIELHSKLHEVTHRPADDPALYAAPPADTRRVLRKVKAPLVGMVVVDESHRVDDGVQPRALRMHGLDASMNVVVRWLTCLDSDTPTMAE